MSTKTTFKRIALVAVAALGLGVLTSVAPASAVNGQTATSISVGTIPASRVGQTVVVPVTIYIPATAVANDTITISAQLTSAPLSGGVANAASAGRPAANNANDAGEIIDVVTTAGAALTGGTNINGRTIAAGTTVAAGNSTNNGFAASVQDEWVITAAAVELGYARVGIALTPDVAGSYTVMVATNATGANGFVAGSPTANFTVTPGSTPTTVTITNVRGSSILAGSTNGALIKLTLDGALGALENISLSTSGNGSISKNVTSPSFATTQVLDSTDFASGAAHVLLRSSGAVAETITLVARGSGALSTSVTATSSYSVTAQAGGSASVFSTIEEPSADALYTSSAQAGTVSAGYTVAPSSTSQTFGLSNAIRTAAAYGFATVTDTLGLVTGVAGAKYDQIITYGITAAASGTTFSVAGNFAAAATGASYSVTVKGGTADFYGTSGDKTFTVTSATRTNAGGFTLSPTTTSYIAAPGAAITIKGELDDQFGAGRGAQEVTITTSGRNNPIATKVFTAADGTFSFTTADASTSTTNLVDTVTFAASGAAAKSVTINYANTAVGTVTVTGGNTTTSVNALTNTVNPISVGSSTTGAEAGAIDVVATVKDANGNALAGVPVTFSVAGTTAAIRSNTVTVYTGSTGTATGKLYAWANGTYTYTAAAGGKTTTGTATFGSITAGNARVISATVSGNVVTGKATDRFGNPVQNAVLYASTTSGANIGGVFVKDGTTAADGTVSWVVTGSGEVTVSAVNPTSVAGTTAYQTAHLAGNATLASATVAAKAYGASTVGTATTAETNVGATFAPAGVASAKVTVAADTSTTDAAQAAADAAAEATDAANAATDAANAAAEAADAATAAAQDAADAVAALSTQVSEMIDALKKQITALTNLVIKIQKKVKA